MGVILKKLFSPYGRLSRGGFWLWAVLFLGVISVAAGLVDEYILQVPYSDEMWPSLLDVNTTNAVYWVSTWPVVVLSVKRFHDLGLSGWWTIALLPMFFLSNELLVTGKTIANVVGPWIYVGSVWLFLIFILNFMQLFIRGNSGENRFGADPLESE